MAPVVQQPAKQARKAGSKVELQPTRPDLTPEDLQAIFGENLKIARLKQGLKQSDVAEQAGVTQQRLSMIEGGEANVTLRTMMRLAQSVGLNVSTMLRPAKSRRAKE